MSIINPSSGFGSSDQFRSENRSGDKRNATDIAF